MPEETTNEDKAEALDDLRMYADMLSSGINNLDILETKTLVHLGVKLREIADILGRD